MAYQPMTMARLAGYLRDHPDTEVRWKYFWEFCEEYRWDPADHQPTLFEDEPEPTGDDRWDALLAAMAEHLASLHDLAAPAWAAARTLITPWFPSQLPSKRAEALVWAPASFRKHGVYLSVYDLQAA
jgi:hypothetical protein